MGIVHLLPVGHSLRLCAIAALAGLISVSAPLDGTGAAFGLLLPMSWAWSPNRAFATLVVTCYYGVASLSSLAGTWQFVDSAGLAALAYLIVIVCSVLPWALLYRSDGQYTALRLGAICVIGLVPPLGFAHPFNPFLGVGLMFPTFGWLAFVLGIALMTLVIRRPLSIALVFVLFSLGINYKPDSLDGWRGFDVHLQENLDHRQEYAVYRRMAAEFADTALKVAIYPEASIGYSVSGSQTVLDDAIGKEQTALVGARDGNEEDWRYSMVRFNREGAETMYRQRLAPPVLSLASGSEPFHRGDTELIDGRRILPVICFEAMTPWPYVLPFLSNDKPDVIVYMGNVAWSDPWLAQYLAGQLRHNVSLWSKIFGVPAVGAVAFPITESTKLASIKK